MESDLDVELKKLSQRMGHNSWGVAAWPTKGFWKAPQRPSNGQGQGDQLAKGDQHQPETPILWAFVQCFLQYS
jgi:hypothetical protein